MTPRSARVLLGLLALSASAPSGARAETFYQQTNLVSDGFVSAPTIDPNLKNPWGASFGPTTPFWVSDQVTGVTTLYTGTGTRVSPPSPVTIQGGNATGQVFKSAAGTGDFAVAENGKSAPAVFLFASLNGTIDGWNPGVDPKALQVATGTNATYTGLALANTAAGNFLYAANARGGIDVYDRNFNPVNLGPNAFKDPNIPSGLTPYNIQNINGTLYVTYSQRGQPGGAVDAYSTNGVLLARVATGGTLNQPWGLVVAPAGFGKFGGDLLVGNFGDGTINAFHLDPTLVGTFVGQLADQAGTPLADPGLWSLNFGNGGPGFSPNTLYLTAGLNGEKDGVFAAVNAVPEPTSAVLLGIGGTILVAIRAGRVKKAPRPPQP